MNGNMMCRNPKRLERVVRRGDKVRALLYTGNNSGFSSDAEVMAVYHWGVYVKLPASTKLGFRTELAEKLLRTQFKVKWTHIYTFYLQ